MVVSQPYRKKWRDVIIGNKPSIVLSNQIGRKSGLLGACLAVAFDYWTSSRTTSLLFIDYLTFDNLIQRLSDLIDRPTL